MVATDFPPLDNAAHGLPGTCTTHPFDPDISVPPSTSTAPAGHFMPIPRAYYLSQSNVTFQLLESTCAHQNPRHGLLCVCMPCPKAERARGNGLGDYVGGGEAGETSSTSPQSAVPVLVRFLSGQRMTSSRCPSADPFRYIYISGCMCKVSKPLPRTYISTRASQAYCIPATTPGKRGGRGGGKTYLPDSSNVISSPDAAAVLSR